MEELSARAGSFKPFRTFAKMLKAALQGCSDTVSLDVLTLAGQMHMPNALACEDGFVQISSTPVR